MTQDETSYLLNLLDMEIVAAKRRADIQKSTQYDNELLNCRHVIIKLLEFVPHDEYAELRATAERQ